MNNCLTSRNTGGQWCCMLRIFATNFKIFFLSYWTTQKRNDSTGFFSENIRIVCFDWLWHLGFSWTRRFRFYQNLPKKLSHRCLPEKRTLRPVAFIRHITDKRETYAFILFPYTHARIKHRVPRHALFISSRRHRRDFETNPPTIRA